MKIIAYIVFLGLAFTFSGAVAAPPLFDRQDLPLDGRLRHVVLKDILPGGGEELIVAERSGIYPQWKQTLTVFGLEAGGRRMAAMGSAEIPPDAIFYGFLPASKNEAACLWLLRPDGFEGWRWKGKGFEPDSALRARIPTGFEPPINREAVPLDFRLPLDTEETGTEVLLVPKNSGAEEWKLKAGKLNKIKDFKAPTRAYYQSDLDGLPFDMHFWISGSLWYPPFSVGQFRASKPDTLIWTWTDEAYLQPLDSFPNPVRISFQQLTEKERDDGKTHVTIQPVDLNGDGRTDFVVNKFQGFGAGLQAQMSLFLTGAEGAVGSKPLVVKALGNRAGGVLAVELNKDGKMDLVVASSQFNAWAIIRALIRRQVSVDFAFYRQKGDGYRLNEPDLSSELSFQFDLENMEIDGLLPNLDGDFNGDGHPDVIYARDRKGLTVLLQRPKEREFFSTDNARTFQVKVPRKIQLGDLDGDGKSDVVLFDRTASGNRTVTVLFNTGLLR